MLQQIEKILLELKNTKPLVLNLTNYVTMDFIANCLLALGAAPIMSVCDAELEELIKIAHSININIGTLDDAFITRAHKAMLLAKQYQKPVVLDPVGSGATVIRTTIARELMMHADIVRGNASEIISLFDSSAKTLGVESINSTDEAKYIAQQLAKKYGLIAVVSGAVDFITDGTRASSLTVGSPLMSQITGMGCALTAVIAAFSSAHSGIGDDLFESSRLAVGYFGLCGNLAANKTAMPGTFRSVFIDELYTANFADMARFYEL